MTVMILQVRPSDSPERVRTQIVNGVSRQLPTMLAGDAITVQRVGGQAGDWRITITANTPDLREHIAEAHQHLMAAQRIAYNPERRAPLLVRLTLNKAETLLMRLLVHRLKEQP